MLLFAQDAVHMLLAVVSLLAIALFAFGLENHRKGQHERGTAYIVASMIIVAVAYTVTWALQHVSPSSKTISHTAFVTVAPTSCTYMFTKCTIAVTVVTGSSKSNVTYSIDWGDGSTTSGVCHSRICIIAHDYTKGNYTIHVTVNGRTYTVKVHVYEVKPNIKLSGIGWFLKAIISGLIHGIELVISWLVSGFTTIANVLHITDLVKMCLMLLWYVPTPNQLPAMSTVYAMILYPWGITALCIGAIVNFLLNFKYFSHDPRRLALQCLEDIAVGLIIALLGPYLYLAFAHIFNNMTDMVLDPTAIGAIVGIWLTVIVTCLGLGTVFSIFGTLAGIFFATPLIMMLILLGVAVLRALLLAGIFTIFPIIGAFWMIPPLRRWVSEPLIAVLFGLMLCGILEASMIELAGIHLYETIVLGVGSSNIVATFVYTIGIIIMLLLAPLVLIFLVSRVAIGHGLTTTLAEVTGNITTTISKILSRAGIDLSKTRIATAIERIVHARQAKIDGYRIGTGSSTATTSETVRDFVREWTRQTAFSYHPTITRLELASSKLRDKISRGIEKVDNIVWRKTKGIVSIRDALSSFARGVDVATKELTGIAPFKELAGVGITITPEDVLKEYYRYLELRHGIRREQLEKWERELRGREAGG